MPDNWKVTAVLASPMGGQAPYLDGLLEWEMAQRQGKARVISRSEPAPEIGAIQIPCLRGRFGGLSGIPRVSAPIVLPTAVRHEHFAKRLRVEHSDLLAKTERKVVAVGNTWTKSYRLPLTVSNVDRVCWFVGGGNRQEMRRLLKSVAGLGKKRSYGYARVLDWEFEPVEHDYSWFAPSEHGTILMRALPFSEELPKDLIGAKRWFGACVCPMWHPDRMMDVVIPC